MNTPRSGSLGALRDANRHRVLAVLRRHGSVSRADISRITGLSHTTVSSLVGQLRRQGLVVEHPRGDARRRSATGRPPVLLSLTARTGAAIGVAFDHRHLRVAVADLSSSVLAERVEDLDVDHEATVALTAAARLVDDVLSEAGIDRQQVLGVGMGLPGPIDSQNGTIGSSVIMPGWAGLAPAAEFGCRVGFPVALDNDANLGALGEVTYGAGRGLRDVIYVKVSAGIGAGLILGGQLYRGSTGIAGEIGHVQVREEGTVCRCGSRGCLETLVSAPKLVELLQPAHSQQLTVARMLELAAHGDAGARRVLVDAGRTVGRVLADLCNHLNPAAIIVGGELSTAGDLLADSVRDAVHHYAQPGTAAAVRIVAGSLGERAEVLGALALVVGDTNRFPGTTANALAAGHHLEFRPDTPL
jgi:glucokinase-like ROK family protein